VRENLEILATETSEMYDDINVTFTFRDSKEVINGIRALYAAQSPVFDAQLHGRMSEGLATHATIHIEDIPYDAFLLLHRTIYGLSVELSDEILPHMWYAAKKYLLSHVEHLCKRYLNGILQMARISSANERRYRDTVSALKQRRIYDHRTGETLVRVMDVSRIKHSHYDISIQRDPNGSKTQFIATCGSFVAVYHLNGDLWCWDVVSGEKRRLKIQMPREGPAWWRKPPGIFLFSHDSSLSDDCTIVGFGFPVAVGLSPRMITTTLSRCLWLEQGLYLQNDVEVLDDPAKFQLNTDMTSVI